MKIRVITAADLTAEHLAAWSAIQQTDAVFDSPYFRPEFTRAVAAVRGDVEIGILEEQGQAVGFFPFQRGRGNVARPVGGRLSDFQGLVVRKDVAWEPCELIRQCGLTAWHFDHLTAAQVPFQSCHWSVAPSPYLDLSRGWEGYQAEQFTLHKESFKRSLRKSRQMTSKEGPFHIEPNTRDPAVFEKMVQWKIEQYQQTGVTNVLQFDWTRDLLRRILDARSEAFSGTMSALYIRDALAAVLLSMRSYSVVHAWFSAYDPRFASASPGMELWLGVARTFPDLGVRRVDLGKGPERFKRQLMSGAFEVAEGSVESRPWMGMVRRTCHRAFAWAHQTPLRRPLRGPGRFLRRMVESRRFR